MRTTRLDVDPLLYSADYSLAHFLEAMLSARLEEDYGEDWWNNKETAEYLKRLWSNGNALSAEELAVEMGYEGGIDPGILTKKIEKALGKV